MNYQLIVRVPFSELDDAAARQKASEILAQVNIQSEKTIKLQRLQENAEPIGVKLGEQNATAN